MHPAPRSLIRALPALGLLLLAVPAWADFIDHGNGTVTDTETGLMWDKCTWSQPALSPSDCSGTPTTWIYNWTDALAVAVTANTSSHRGYGDWRLPNKNELESLVDIRGGTPPAIDATAFPNTPANYYWSSTTYAPVPANAWCVYFFNGDTDAYYKDNDNHVRLVRSGQSFDPSDLLGSLITATANPAGGGTVTCAPSPVSSGGSSSCTATPKAGYRFSRWDGDCTGGGTCVLNNVTAPRSVTARFTPTGSEPIPAVGPWGLSLLVALLAGLAGFQLRRLPRSRR